MIDFRRLRQVGEEYALFIEELIIRYGCSSKCDRCGLENQASIDDIIEGAIAAAKAWYGGNWRCTFVRDELEWRCNHCLETYGDN